MRILIVPSWYPTVSKPVNGIFIREQAEALSKVHDVRVLFLDVPARGQREGPTSGVTEREGYVEETRTVPNIPLLWQFLYVLVLVRAFAGLRKGFKPDVVHCHVAVPAGWGGAFLRRIFGVPLIITENKSEFDSWLGRRGLRFMASFAYSQADIVIAVSTGLKQRIQDNFQKVRRLELVPNIVDFSLFRPTPLPELGDTYRLLFVGLMETDQKGVGFLLQALTALQTGREKGVHVSLAGDGKLREEYRRMAQSLGVAENVSFLGLQTPSQIASLLGESHALVLPSLHEALPLVIIEALASGRPVIATRCGGPESMISASNGLIVEPGNSAALAEAIHTLLANLQRYNPQQISENAAKLYSRQAVVEKLTELYRSLPNAER